jgi:hypothetical protein
MRETRISTSVDVPGGQSAIATARNDRRANGRPSFRVGVEHEPRPSGLGRRTRDEVCEGDRVRVDDGLVERCKRCRRDRILTAVDSNAEPPLADSRSDLDVDVEWAAADLLEPEAMLLHEIECEPVRARHSWRRHGNRELDALAGGKRVRQRSSRPIPHDRVVEPVEPVERDLDAVGTL